MTFDQQEKERKRFYSVIGRSTSNAESGFNKRIIDLKRSN